MVGMTSSLRTPPLSVRRERGEPVETRPGDLALIKGDLRNEQRMVLWVQLALLAIAANAVLIQTLVTDDSPLKNIIRVGVLLLTVFAMFVRRTILPGGIIALVLLSAVLLLLTHNPDQLTVIYVLLIVPAMWSINERALTRALMLASVFALLLVFAFLVLGLTTNELRLSQTSVTADIRARYTFGTAGVPFFMNIVYGAAVFVIYYAYRWRLRGRLLLAGFVLAGSYWIFTQTDGRGGFLAILIFCGIAMTMPALARSGFVRGLLAIQPVLLLGLNIWLATQRNNPEINQLFSYRPLLFGKFIDTVTFWDVLTSSTVKQGDIGSIDSSYLHLLFGAGLIIFVAFCLMFGRAVLTMVRRKMNLELAFLTSVMVYASLESILLRAENVFILFAWYLIMRYSMGDGQKPAGHPSDHYTARTSRTPMSAASAA